MTESLAIEAAGLQKSYNSARVVDGIDIEVPAGNVYALLGANGAGKTTTVRMLATLTAPDAGTGTGGGMGRRRPAVEARRRISLHRSVRRSRRAPDRRGEPGDDRPPAGSERPAARARARELLSRFELVDAGGRRVATYFRRDAAPARPRRVADPPAPGDLPRRTHHRTGSRSRQQLWEQVGELAARPG